MRELVINAGFKDSMRGWEQLGPEKAQQISISSPGEWYVQLLPAGTIRQTVPIAGNASYDFTFRARTHFSGKLVLTLTGNRSGELVKKTYVDLRDWTPQRITLTTGEGEGTLTITVENVGPAGSVGNFQYPSLKPVNLVHNGSFEQGLQPWVCERKDGGSCQIMEGREQRLRRRERRSDTAAMCLQAPASLRQAIAVSGNTTYTLSWNSTLPPQTRESNDVLRITVERENGEPLADKSIDSWGASEETALTFTTGNKETRLSVVLSALYGSAFIDDVALEPQSSR
ncbi:hypothetical protein EPA93_28265 [Ktedonosporobacter rubrisoli]|uniref:CBM-cenC domain-containing protein n=1 Tax=Ktedonosporobacter rubrisoli TaxID=2509675 RepID=A0A4P6JWA7_KTERU|nr:carbohydrate binding domain-containing protein [Ktedonosporobacter rubrisoli]QBD79662.1 hypothetical protein EPA93_28265 [Ktedonosporobacter rubrisoli]